MRRILLLCCLSLILASCSSVRFISIEVQKPAKVILGSNIRDIAFVNNSVTQPEDVGHWKIVKKETEPVNVPSDSLNIMLNQALAQFLEEDGSFNRVAVYDKPLRKDKDFLMETALDSAVIQNIGMQTGADAILSLDKIILITTHETIQFKDKLQPWALCIAIGIKYNVYSTATNRRIRGITYNDSICWKGTLIGSNLYSEDIPTYKKAFEHTIIRAADKISKSLSSSWNRSERWYYTDGSTAMNKASVKASGYKWREAATIWGNLYETEKKERKKGKLASNIALANEMLDDIENAVTWIDLALGHFNNADKRKEGEDSKLAKMFKKELERRLADFAKLNTQFGVE